MPMLISSDPTDRSSPSPPPPPPPPCPRRINKRYREVSKRGGGRGEGGGYRLPEEEIRNPRGTCTVSSVTSFFLSRSLPFLSVPPPSLSLLQIKSSSCVQAEMLGRNVAFITRRFASREIPHVERFVARGLRGFRSNERLRARDRGTRTRAQECADPARFKLDRDRVKSHGGTSEVARKRGNRNELASRARARAFKTTYPAVFAEITVLHPAAEGRGLCASRYDIPSSSVN